MNLNEAKEILKNNGYTINESTFNYKLLTKKYEVVPIIFDAIEKNGVAVIYQIGEFMSNGVTENASVAIYSNPPDNNCLYIHLENLSRP